MESLKQRLAVELSKSATFFREFPWESKQAYAEWLAQTYFYVCHSTRLLALAASRFDVTQNALHIRFIEHMKEERSHEALALADLRTLGYRISDFTEAPTTAALYSAQYYLIERNDPAALFGYILFLEGLSVEAGQRACQKVIRAFGREAAHFLSLHAEDDHDHIAKALSQMDSLPEARISSVLRSLTLTSEYYVQMLRKMRDEDASLSAKAV